MLNATPSGLTEEIRAAEAARKTSMQRANRSWDLYMGSEGGSGKKRSIENLPFSLVNLIMPNMVFNNPKVSVNTRLPHTERAVAEGQRYVLNRWVSDIDLADQLQYVAYEFLFSYGVMKISIQSQPGYDDNREFVPQRPFAQHIRSDSFIIDSKNYTPGKSRLMGDTMLIDKSDLEKDKRVNKEVLANAAKVERLEDEFGGNPNDRIRSDHTADRNQVQVYEIWVPEIQLKEKELPKSWVGPPPSRRNGYNGTIYTLVKGGSDQEDGWLREPRPFYGPPWGPYTLFGAYWTRDWSLPVSPLSMVIDQAEDFNNLAIVNSEASKDYKRFVVTQNESVGAKIASISHGNCATVPGFDPQSAQQYEIGGVTNQMQNQESLAEQRLDRNIGLGGAVKTPKKGITATAETIAEEKTDVRLSWMESRFMKGVTQVIKSASWYFHYTPEMVYGIGDQKTGMEGTFIGGENLEDVASVASLVSPELLANVQESIETGQLTAPPRGSWYNLEIEVDLYSTRRTDEAMEQKRAIETLNILMQIAPVMKETPYMAWDEILDMLGERINKRSLGSLVDLDMLEQVAQIQLATGLTKKGVIDSALSLANPDGTRLQGLQSGGELAGQVREAG